MKLHNIAAPLTNTKAQALVLFAYSSDKKVSCDAKGTQVDGALSLLSKAVDSKRFRGGNKEAVFFRSPGVDGFEHVLVVGLGDRKKISDENLRGATAVAVKTLNREKISTAAVHVGTIRKITKSPQGAGLAISE